MILKQGTKFGDLDPAILLAAIVADGVWQELGVLTGATLTSGQDGTHSVASLHYPENTPNGKCRAIDIRTRNLASHTQKQVAAKMVKERLTADYDVVLETDHLHVELDPK